MKYKRYRFPEKSYIPDNSYSAFFVFDREKYPFNAKKLKEQLKKAGFEFFFDGFEGPRVEEHWVFTHPNVNFYYIDLPAQRKFFKYGVYIALRPIGIDFKYLLPSMKALLEIAEKLDCKIWDEHVGKYIDYANLHELVIEYIGDAGMAVVVLGDE